MIANKEPVAGHEQSNSKMGRPNIYNPEMVAELCAYLAQGESLRTACAREGMPALPTVFRWLSASNTEPWADDFREQYARAKEEAADAMAEEILYIADTPQEGEEVIVKGDREEIKRGDMLGHRRLQIDTRKFLMAKMKPKKYGEKLDLTSGGDKINRGMSIEEINAVLARAEAEKNKEIPQDA